MTSIVIHSPNRAIFRNLLISRGEHVSYVSAQVRRQVQAKAVGKVDEIHNVNLGTRHGAEASDTLKYFAERLPVTFAYAGISVERAGLLSGTRGEQIAGRFSMIRTRIRYPLGCRRRRATRAELTLQAERTRRSRQAARTSRTTA